MKYLFLALLLIVPAASIVVVGQQHPDTIRELLIKVDVFGISDEAEKEKNRLAQIKMLPIPYEQKDVLANRTVFLGATEDMVLLALGQPKTVTKTPTTGQIQTQSTWVYYFTNDKRPTMLVFENSVLISAHKGSVLDIVTGQNTHQ